jgi:hypothetical protein
MGGAISVLLCFLCKSGCSATKVAAQLTFFPPMPPCYRLVRKDNGEFDIEVEDFLEVHRAVSIIFSQLKIPQVIGDSMLHSLLALGVIRMHCTPAPPQAPLVQHCIRNTTRNKCKARPQILHNISTYDPLACCLQRRLIIMYFTHYCFVHAATTLQRSASGTSYNETQAQGGCVMLQMCWRTLHYPAQPRECH